MLNAMQCGSMFFSASARKDLPFIAISRELKEKYPDFFKELPSSARNGQFLYNPADVAAWLRANLRSTVTTVMVSLTKFTAKPDVMRSVFENLRKERISAAFADDKSGHRSKAQLCFWPELQALIKPEYKEEVWAFPADVAEAAERQGRKTDKIDLPAYPVRLPEGIIPKFFNALGVARTRKSESRTTGQSIVRNFAWARHEFPIGNANP